MIVVQSSYLFMRFLQVFHENSNNNINENKLEKYQENVRILWETLYLSNQNKDHEEERGYKYCDAAVLKTFFRIITFLSQSVFHNTIPIVSCHSTITQSNKLLFVLKFLISTVNPIFCDCLQSSDLLQFWTESGKPCRMIWSERVLPDLDMGAPHHTLQ